MLSLVKNGKYFNENYTIRQIMNKLNVNIRMSISGSIDT